MPAAVAGLKPQQLDAIKQRVMKEKLQGADIERAYTEGLNLPVWHGFHDWHRDGEVRVENSHQLSPLLALDAAAQQLWVMVDKNASEAETNLLVIPADAHRRYASQIGEDFEHLDPEC